MKLVIGLGNPGKEYANTYHSLGALFADHLIASMSHEIIKQKADYTLIKFESFHLIKSHVFMNNSYLALRETYSLYKLTPENLLVAHDELMIKKHDIKLKKGGGNAGHNGLRNISSHIGANFARLRIGTDHPHDNLGISVADYVLSKIDNITEYEIAFAQKGVPLLKEWLLP